MSTQKQHLETIALHAGQVADPTTDACAVPIYQTASYVFHNAQHAADRFGLRDAGNIYGRLTNSTQGVLEDRIAALEGGVAGLAVASGAAAITYSLQNVLQAGDHIVAADNLYGGSYNLITHTLAASGIAHSIVKINDLAALEAAIRPNTKVIYAETLGNPNSDVLNIEGVAEVAHKHGIVFIVDNTFAPLLIRPLEHGADIVVHSATKFIGGHGTSLGGVIVDGGKFDWKANADRYPSIAKPDASYHGAVFADVAGPAAFVTRIRAVILRDTGAAISPFNAWILLQGVESLPLRIERHTENALKVVEYLAKHPLVEKVNHTPDRIGAMRGAFSIRDIAPHIFAWLDVLDMNVVMILILMMAIGGFTVISGLLIVMLERINMIGTLKVLGATNVSVRNIFIQFSIMLVGQGLIWGNVFGLLLCWIQQQFHLISLDASVYYIDSVPIQFNWWLILGINVATLLISTLVIWGSSHLISIGKPSETMRYE